MRSGDERTVRVIPPGQDLGAESCGRKQVRAMKHLFVAFVIATVAGSAFGQLDPCATVRNTIEINACANQSFKATEAELNAMYKKVLDSLSAPNLKSEQALEMKRLLVQAQRAWVSYRENDCKAWWTLHQDGTSRTAEHLGCLESRAKQRIEQLRQWAQP